MSFIAQSSTRFLPRINFVPEFEAAGVRVGSAEGNIALSVGDFVLVTPFNSIAAAIIIPVILFAIVEVAWWMSSSKLQFSDLSKVLGLLPIPGPLGATIIEAFFVRR